jgi:hypothetical protein
MILFLYLLIWALTGMLTITKQTGNHTSVEHSLDLLVWLSFVYMSF